ncbi:MAG: O-linked N-acetylglucosamine transferase, SPINDLY family protein [Betaproteobacteria bacterium]
MNWLKRILGAKDAPAPAEARPVASTPDPAAHYAEAIALIERGESEEALRALQGQGERSPDLPQVQLSLGYVLCHMGRTAEGLAAYRRALEMKPDDVDAHSNLLLALNYSAEHTATELFEAHRRFGQQIVLPVASPDPERTAGRRLRVGYLSPDYYAHVVACFLLPIVARHDRARFEVFCYYTRDVNDAVTDGLRGLADRWADCAGRTDAEIAARIRSDRIDILVDLAGHTAHQRLAVLALRPAPVQVTYLGYPNTTGLAAVDWRITDAMADPPGEADRLNVERLLRLPRSFLCYRPGPETGPVPPLPAGSGGRITFGCFNNLQKLSDPFLAVAARVLAAVPGAQLVIKAKPLQFASVREHLAERFRLAGGDTARLALRPWAASVREHIEAYGGIDIALDSFPYNGTTTTCEALWMGAPVVTLAGDRHASRVGASLLHSMGLDSLVARDAEDFVRIAASLARDLPALARLRAGLRDRLKRSPLMDETGFVRELEDAYLGIWQEKLARTAPDLDEARIHERLAQARARKGAGELDQAKIACDEVLDARPAELDALELHWQLCNQTGDQGASILRIGAAIATGRFVARHHYMLGCAFEDAGRAQEATASYREALALDPAFAKAANNLGALRQLAGDLAQAMQYYEQAVRADPELFQALINLADLHKRLGSAARALPWLRKALEREPRHPDLNCALVEALMYLYRLDEALEHGRIALEIAPQYERAHFGVANVLQAMGRTRESEASLREALRLKPDFAAARSNLVFYLHYHRGNEPEALYEEHREWNRLHALGVPREPLRAPDASAPDRRLRIGYLSPNFHRHSVAYFLEPLLEARDRGAFQVHAYYNSSGSDEVTARLRAQCDAWADVFEMDDAMLARRIAADRIDILVDLAGHTGGGRMGVFARKPAPVQATWLGYPDTTGLDAMDWRLTDAIADPPGEADRLCSERLLRLDQGFLCYRPPEVAPEVAEPPSAGVGHVTFGSFNNLAKLTPELVTLWARLLARLPGTRMLVKAQGLGSEAVQRAMRDRFAAEGVAADRVTLLDAERAVRHHLERYAGMDIALDSFPYHGTTTTFEALWMGVPVVVLEGRAHVSRVGVSILRRLGLDELVARDEEDYIAKAAALAADPERLRRLRAGLRERMRDSPLMDAAAFTRSIEAAYRRMWEDYLIGGKSPDRGVAG